MRKPVRLPKWLMIYAVGAVVAMLVAAGCNATEDGSCTTHHHATVTHHHTVKTKKI